MKPVNLLAAVLGLILLAGLTVFILHDGEETSPPLEGTTPQASGAAAAGGDTDPLSGEAVTPSTEPIEAQPFVGDDPAAEEAAGEPPLVVLATDSRGAPLAGARVEVRGPSSRAGRSRLRAALLGIPPQAPLLARAITAPSGRAPFSAALLQREELQITAHHDGGTGFRIIEPDTLDSERLVEVPLLPPRVLEVNVTFPDGSPAGNIQVQVTAEDRQERGRSFFNRMRATSWTDGESGHASFRLTPELPGLHESGQLHVTAVLPGAEGVIRTVEPERGQVTRVDLEIPASVLLEVELRDPDGSLHEETARLLWTASEQRLRSSRRGIRRGLMLFGQRRVEGGRTRLGGFRPGMAYSLTVMDPWRITPPTQVDLPEEGGLRRVVVQVGAPLPRLAVNLVKPDGLPLAGVALQSRVSYEGGRDRDFRGRGMMRRWMRNRPDLRTDETGRVLVPVQPERAGSVELELEGVRRRGWGRRGGDGDPPLAELDFAALSPDQVVDQGRVVVDLGPIVVAGRVVDPAGNPQAGAHVEVAWTPAPSQDDRRFRSRFSGLRVQRLRTRTDGEGRFELRGHHDPEGRFTIRARGGRMASARETLVPGSSNVSLVMQPLGGLRGRVRKAHPELEGSARLRVRLLQEDQDVPVGARWLTISTEEDGTFERRDLAPGAYEIQVRFEGMVELEVPRVLVPSGKVAAPGALQDLVVGAERIPASVRVTDHNGRPVENATVLPRAELGEDGRYLQMHTTDAQGRVTILLPPRYEDLRMQVRSPGHRTVHLRNPTFPVEVRLQAPTSLEVHLRPSWTPPQEIEMSLLRLLEEGGDEVRTDEEGRRFRRRFRSEVERLDAGMDRLYFRELKPGSYTIRLSVRGADGSAYEGRRATIELGEVELPPGNNATRLTWNRQQIIQALEKAVPRSRDGR